MESKNKHTSLENKENQRKRDPCPSMTERLSKLSSVVMLKRAFAI